MVESRLVENARPYDIRRVATLSGGVLFTEILGTAALSDLLDLLDLDLPERIEQLACGSHRAFVMSTVHGALNREVVFFVPKTTPQDPDGMFRISMSVPSGLDEEQILSFLKTNF